MKIIDDITRFIFVEDKPQEADIIFIPGGSFPALPEKAAELYREGYSRLLLPSGGVSVKRGQFTGVKEKAEIYSAIIKQNANFIWTR